jgi:hypothetical protein
MSQVIDASGNKAFDLRTELRDHKTGKVVIHQPYRMHVSKEHGTRYERHGVLYHPNGERVDGRPVTPVRVAPPKPVRDEEDEAPKGEQIAPGVYAPVVAPPPAEPVAPDATGVFAEIQKAADAGAKVPVAETPKQEAPRNGTQTGNRSRT